MVDGLVQNLLCLLLVLANALLGLPIHEDGMTVETLLHDPEGICSRPGDVEMLTLGENSCRLGLVVLLLFLNLVVLHQWLFSSPLKELALTRTRKVAPPKETEVVLLRVTDKEFRLSTVFAFWRSPHHLQNFWGDEMLDRWLDFRNALPQG